MNSKLDGIIKCDKCNIVLDKNCRVHSIESVLNETDISLRDVLLIIKNILKLFLTIYFCILINKLTDKKLS